MKKIFYILAILAFGFTQAQPQKVNYQAVALTAGGQTVKNQAIKLRLSIVDSSATGTVLYTETHQPTTDGAGQFSVFLGGGTATVGTFSSIAWSNGKDKFLKAEADVTGGTNYVLMGSSQIVSVPYAIAAGSLKEGATITGANGSQYTLTVGANGPTWNLTNPNVNFNCWQAVTYAGENYPTVQIGTQCWFAKNLNVGTMINSFNIIDSQRNNQNIEKYCYNNDPSYCNTFGGLYQWAEAVQYHNGATNSNSPNNPFGNNTRGICPIGWHVPSNNDWWILESYLGVSVAGGELKSTSNLWLQPNRGATNSTGFTALPGGLRDLNGGYNYTGMNSFFWTSTESNPNDAYRRHMDRIDAPIYNYSVSKNFGNSVRCLKD